MGLAFNVAPQMWPMPFPDDDVPTVMATPALNPAPGTGVTGLAPIRRQSISAVRQGCGRWAGPGKPCARSTSNAAKPPHYGLCRVWTLCAPLLSRVLVSHSRVKSRLKTANITISELNNLSCKMHFFDREGHDNSQSHGRMREKSTPQARSRAICPTSLIAHALATPTAHWPRVPETRAVPCR